MSRFSVNRAAAVLVVLSALLIGMSGRVAYLQTWGRERTLRSAERQQHQSEVLYARRGGVFDSTGTLMAGTVQNQDLFVDPKFLADFYTADDKDYNEYLRVIGKLAKLIDKPEAELSALLSDRSESRYVKVATELDDTTVAAVQKLQLPGVGFTPSDQRFYPIGSIASHLLGGTAKTATASTGSSFSSTRSSPATMAGNVRSKM